MYTQIWSAQHEIVTCIIKVELGGSSETLVMKYCTMEWYKICHDFFPEVIL
jgi:hypothetical protein